MLILAGKKFEVKELDFTNMVCDLEDRGVDVISLMNGDTTKIFSASRAIVSVLTGNNNIQECGSLITEHIKSGGDFNDIMQSFMEAMEKAGFGATAEQEETAEEEPQTKPAKAAK